MKIYFLSQSLATILLLKISETAEYDLPVRAGWPYFTLGSQLN